MWLGRAKPFLPQTTNMCCQTLNHIVMAPPLESWEVRLVLRDKVHNKYLSDMKNLPCAIFSKASCKLQSLSGKNCRNLRNITRLLKNWLLKQSKGNSRFRSQVKMKSVDSCMRRLLDRFNYKHDKAVHHSLLVLDGLTRIELQTRGDLDNAKFII